MKSSMRYANTTFFPLPGDPMASCRTGVLPVRAGEARPADGVSHREGFRHGLAGSLPCSRTANLNMLDGPVSFSMRPKLAATPCSAGRTARTNAPKLASVPLWAALLLLLVGCGYRAGTLIPADVRTVHVEMFDNDTFRHGMEIPLSRAVQKEVARRTHLQIVPRERADTILSGTIRRMDAPVTAYDQVDEVAVQRMYVQVRFEWRRRATGEVIASSDRLEDSVRILVARGETQATAAEDAFSDLAEAIVERMQEDF